MSQISSSLNYMDKIPVKIPEKYKPPPKISLPYNINQRLNNLNELLESGLIEYDFSLERNVLAKIQEWKTVRNKERENRRERMRKYELNRIREIEEKQKQLLTAVSYPSTDDLSSDEESTGQAEIKTTLEQTELSNSSDTANGIKSKESTTAVTSTTSAPDIGGTNNTGTVQFSPSHQNFNTILTPTVVPDPVLNRVHNDVHNAINYKINYSDFENDTSSPFDNIELKTINDLDILAQVLNISNQKHSNISTPTNVDTNTNTSTITSDISSKSATNTAVTVDNNSTTVETVKTGENHSNLSANNDSNLNDNFQYSNLVKTTDNHTSPAYYYNSSPKIDGTADISSQILSSNANNFYPTSSVQSSYDNSEIIRSKFMNVTNTQQQEQQQQIYNATLDAITTTTANMNEIISRKNINFYNFYNNLPNNQNYDNYLYKNYPLDYGNYSNNPHHPVEIDSSNNSFHNQDVNVYQQTVSYTVTPNQNTFNDIYNGDNISTRASTTIFGLNSSNKSKSVPDILKELNDEIRDSEMKRNERRRYQDLESYENKQLLMGNNSNNKKYDDKTPDTFMKLSPSSQILAKNISLMGFPLERVCKIAEMFGNDDKKIVEHLIPLSELLDLGFDETKISEALIKFDNNKEKALDFLIS